MPNPRVSIFPFLIGFIVLTLVTAPYLYAATLDMGEYSFSGFLFNPLDGNSYLSKMYQGWQGQWRYRLPYTAEPGDGGYLFLFYIALGHLSRIFHLALITTYHLARLVGAVALLLSLYWFFTDLFSHSSGKRWAFAFSALGSGMGWVLIPFGGFTADFWVAEIYPFLSSFATPHFSFGLALIVTLISLGRQRWKRRPKIQIIIILVAAFALSIIAPFGVVVSLVVLVGTNIMKGFQKRKAQSHNYLPKYQSIITIPVIAVFIGGIPMLLYDFGVARIDPVFSIWNAQNITPSPQPWDILISLAPLLLLAILEFLTIVKHNNHLTNAHILFMVWLGLGLVMMYIPFSLQRRFAMGLYIPTSGLAALAVRRFAGDNFYKYRLYSLILLVLIIPSNMVILLTAQYGIRTHDPTIYLSKDEAASFKWIEMNTLPHSLILASPEIGLFIPAHTGRRVIYGHPFETANAQSERKKAIDFFASDLSDKDAINFLFDRGVNYIFYGVREKELGEPSVLDSLEPVFSNREVDIYRVVD